jgi:hypothetical protein
MVMFVKSPLLGSTGGERVYKPESYRADEGRVFILFYFCFFFSFFKFIFVVVLSVMPLGPDTFEVVHQLGDISEQDRSRLLCCVGVCDSIRSLVFGFSGSPVDPEGGGFD